jgi:glycosyltransferase involved in cell wall biosynthesis
MQAQLVNLLNGLVKCGFEIHLVLYHAGSKKGFFCDALNVPSNNIVRLGASGGFKFKVARYIWSESGHHDLVVSLLHSANFYVTCAKVLNLIVRKNRKFRNVVVDMSSFNNRWSWWLGVMSFVSMLFANRVVSNSDTQHAYYRKLPGGERKSVFIPNGVDGKRFFVPFEDWQQEERDFFLVVGRVSRAKNGPAFVKALDQVSSELGRLCKVVWVGRFDDDPMAQDDKMEMDKLISELVSQGRLEWTWAGEVADVGWYYSRAVCLTIPSRWEGVPNVLVEAMMAGCPVVSTPVSDMPQILGKNERGIVCEGIEAGHIAHGIMTFSGLKSQEIDEMRLRAQQHAAHEFSVNNMVDRYIRALTEVGL